MSRNLDDLVALQARLRAPDGCPWDREQTHQTLRTYLIEEAYEVLEALEGGDDRKLVSELGDLLLQIVFHAQIGAEERRFNIADVVESIHTKLVRRHPHVFGEVPAANSRQVVNNWEEIKAGERKAENAAAQQGASGESLLDGVPHTLPAVLEAHQLTRRAARIGFDWENLDGLVEKLAEEIAELRQALARDGEASARTEEEAGDLLFVAVNVARFLGVDPELAIKKANRKFDRRFRAMEAAAAAQGRRLADVPRAEMEKLWEQAK